MFVFLVMTPIIMLACGFFMYKFPPKNVNSFVGYRTKRSKRNSDTWLYANQYCGKIWIALGFIMLVLAGITAGILILEDIKIDDKIGLIVEFTELTVLLISIIPVEIKLKNMFDENGNRR